MPEYIVQITLEEEKALLTNIISIQGWLDNAIHEKARRVIDSVITENTDRQPKKMSVEDKHEIVSSMTLQTAVERNAIHLVDMNARPENKEV